MGPIMFKQLIILMKNHESINKNKGRKTWNFKSKNVVLRSGLVFVNSLSKTVTKTADFIKRINSLSKTDDSIKMIDLLNKTDEFIKTDKFS